MFVSLNKDIYPHSLQDFGLLTFITSVVLAIVPLFKMEI